MVCFRIIFCVFNSPQTGHGGGLYKGSGLLKPDPQNVTWSVL